MAPKAMKKAGSPPPMKKARKADPVKEKSDIVLKYLKDTDNCEVQGPATCRDMLIQALPHALGSGAASDQRCDFQTNLGAFVGEVISGSVAKWQAKVNDAQSSLDACEAEKTVADNNLAECASQVEKQKKVVEDNSTQLKENKEAEKEAQKALAAAKKEVGNFDSELASKVDEKADSQSVFDDNFQVLKVSEYTGKFPKSKLDAVMSLLQSLNTDASMIGALPLALKKKVEDRGKFDEMVVSGSETLLQDHLKALDDIINNGEKTKAEKAGAVDAAGKVLESATAKKEASAESLKFAEEVCKGAVIAEKDAKKTVDQKAAAVAKAKGKHAVEEVGLEKAQAVLEAYNYLKDRISTTKDEEEDAGEAQEPPASPSRLASLGSKVSGLFFSPTKPEPKEE